MKRLSSFLVFVLVLSFACNPATEQRGGGGDADVEPAPPEEVTGTLEVWGFGTDNAIAKARADGFARAYPNVDVRLTPGDFDVQKFLSAVASGNPPDVIYIGRQGDVAIGSLATRGALQPIDEFIDAAGIDTGVFYEETFAPVQVDGQTYGLPEFNNIIVAYVNNAALQDAGVSVEEIDFSDWEGLAQLNERLTRMEGGNPARIGFDPKLPEFTPLWAEANGGSILNEDGTEVTFDDPATVEAVDYAASLREPYGGQEAYSGFSQSWDIFGEQNPFAADQVGITLFEQWYLNVLADVSPDVDITVMPFTTHEGGEEITYVTGNTWALPRGARNPQAAVAWMQHMTSTETWVEAARAAKEEIEGEGGLYVGTYTGNREADQRIFSEVYQPNDIPAFDQAVEVILGLQEQAFALPPTGADAEINQAMVDAVNEVLLGRMTAEQALQEGDQEAQQALDEAQQTS